MAFEREFAEILQEKLKSDSSASTDKVAKNPILAPFPEWKFHFSTPKRTFVPVHFSRIYPKTKPNKPTKTHPIPAPPATTSPKETIYKIGELGLEHISALNDFQKLGAKIEADHISLSLIKKEFRRLAKVYHPDYSSIPGSEKYFQCLCLNSRQLEEAVLNLSKK